MSDLVERLNIKAGVMEMGEKIAWGSDTALMREAAAEIARLRLSLSEARATGRGEGLSEAAKIAENIHAWKHCDGDFEANQVAAAIRAAMEKAE